MSEFAAEWPDPSIEPVSLLALADHHALYAMLPQVSQDDAEHTLAVTAIYSNFRPHNTYPIRRWRIEVVSPDAVTRYAETDTPAPFANPFPVRATTLLSLPEDIDPLTPAVVVITPLYSNPVAADSMLAAVTLNRPGDIVLPDDALPVDLNFGDAITLAGYTLAVDSDEIDLTLYWQTDDVLPENYQIFVHVLDAAGNILEQADSAPAHGRYPHQPVAHRCPYRRPAHTDRAGLAGRLRHPRGHVPPA